MIQRHGRELGNLVKARQSAFDSIQLRRDAEKTSRGEEPNEVTNKYVKEFGEKAAFYKEKEKSLISRHHNELETRIQQENENREENKKVQSLLSDLKAQQREPANQNDLSEKERKRQEVLKSMERDQSQEKDKGYGR